MERIPVWYYLIVIVITLSLGSYSTYNKDIRDSKYFFYIMLASAIIGNYVWVYCSKRLNDGKDILLFSMLWDIITVVCYYALPLIYVGTTQRLGWQTYLAATSVIACTYWFKVTLGE